MSTELKNFMRTSRIFTLDLTEVEAKEKEEAAETFVVDHPDFPLRGFGSEGYRPTKSTVRYEWCRNDKYLLIRFPKAWMRNTHTLTNATLKRMLG